MKFVTLLTNLHAKLKNDYNRTLVLKYLYYNMFVGDRSVNVCKYYYFVMLADWIERKKKKIGNTVLN